MILRATVYVTPNEFDTPTPTPPPFPRAVLQEEAADEAAFRNQIYQRVRAKFPSRRLDIEFGPIGIPWSQQ